MREPGATHKEDWETGTSAALAGGITTVLVMPNTSPPITNAKTMDSAIQTAEAKAHCDFAQFLGADPQNAKLISQLASKSAGLKMYLDQTYGDLRLHNMTIWMTHLKNWPGNYPIAIHAEKQTMAAAILFAVLYDKPIHICHVSLEEEILLIRAAKERGIKITCEVTPHHLFLSDEDISTIGKKKSEVRPRLAGKKDVKALWNNLEVIDCFATDHAPHTLEEKEGENPPPGFPGLETMLPLLLNAVKGKRLTLKDILLRLDTNPRKIFNIPQQPNTFLEIDPDKKWEIKAENLHSRCGWTPFEGLQVYGSIENVILRGQEVFASNQIIIEPGYGKNIRN